MARAQSAVDGFDPGANANVRVMAVQPDGRIVVAGDFTGLGGGTGTTPLNRVGRLNADGSVDASLDPGAGANAGILFLRLQSDGKVLVGGGFSSLRGATRSQIGRLHPDGSLDTSFDPAANATVRVLAVQANGQILMGGDFTTLGPSNNGATSRSRIGRLHANGTLDDSFDPGANGLVFAIEEQADGRILVGGSFTTLGGATRNRIGRLNADGSLDTSFNPGANATIYAMALQLDGKIVVAGEFTMIGGGGTGTTVRSKVARLHPNGSVDDTFNPGANSFIFKMAVEPNGKIVVVGDFTTLGGGGTGTTTRNRIGRLHPDGTLDTTFNPGTNAQTLAVAVQPDGKILTGGTFTTLGGGTGTTTRNRIGRLYADGSLDTSFDPSAAGSSVNALAVQSDGKILVGGDFTQLGGQARSRLGRLHPDGSLDTSFDPAPDNTVTAVALQADGKILVSGQFTLLGGQARSRIGRLNPDGSVDQTFDPGANDLANALVVQPDGKILVGGQFTTLGGGGTGTTARSRIGRLNADGSLDMTFDPGASALVTSLVLQQDGKTLVGGGFGRLGGGGTGLHDRVRIGRLNPDGSLDFSFDPGAEDGAVNALAVQSDGKILVGGFFSGLGGGARNRIGRLNADGSLDLGFDPGANNPVDTVAVQVDGKILVGGQFTMLGGGTGTTPRNYIGRLNADGSLDMTFDPGANSLVSAWQCRQTGSPSLADPSACWAGAGPERPRETASAG